MLLKKKNLIGLNVKTKSGKELGVVCDFEFDGEQHTIVGYYIKKSKLLPDFVSDELIIRPKQIIKIDQEKMIVDDMLIKEIQPETAAQPST